MAIYLDSEKMIKSQVESIKVIFFHMKKSTETVQNKQAKPLKCEYKFNILNNLYLVFFFHLFLLVGG